MTGGISGNTIVGIYNDTVNDNNHGFVATIPEPSTLSLLGSALLGLAALYLRRRRHSVPLGDDEAGPAILSMLPSHWTGAARRAA
jgi:hypothetical protein